MKKILYFSAVWCSPCRVLAPKMDELAKEITIEKVDVDSQSDIANKFGITSIPTVIMTVDGEEKQRYVGAQNPKVYVEMYNKY
jgi:thioredoxin 1